MTPIKTGGLCLALVMVAGCSDIYRDDAQRALTQAGYPATPLHVGLWGCMKGRYPFIADYPDGRKVKVCIGGAFLGPKVTEIHRGQAAPFHSDTL